MGEGRGARGWKGPVSERQYGDKSSVIKHFGAIRTPAGGGREGGGGGAARLEVGGMVAHLGGLLMNARGMIGGVFFLCESL